MQRRVFLQGLLGGALWGIARPYEYERVKAQGRSDVSDWPLFRRDLARTGRAVKTGKITTPKERWSAFTRGLVESSAAVGDLDGDGRLEVVVGS
ncbi:MAG: FG-GAP repeat protein, partial [Candidatus Bipolaricaulota bacterium]|nr:FG-GAP repeat protein [Candidatus Bipolaricaulota bacterium]